MDGHLSEEQRHSLKDALGEAQRISMLGPEPLDSVIDRSLAFTRLIPAGTETVLDVGSGGGDPGLVIAVSCPSVALTLVDRRSKRTDLLVRLVGRLGLSSRIEVIEADVADLPTLFPWRSWDVCTSRGFGPPSYTATLVAPLLRNQGLLLVTEPPGSQGERWLDPEIEEHHFRLERVESGVAVLVKQL